MAAATTSAVVGPAVMVLPQRNVLQVAKEAATIDFISGGRFVLGVGSGWNRPEMEALGYPFKGRTRRFEEQLDVLRSCWSGRPDELHGDQIDIPADLMLFPTPVNATGLPVLVGGMAPPALRRAAVAGGWMGISAAHAWDPSAMDESMRLYRAGCDEVGTKPRAVLKLHSSPDELDLVAPVVREAIEDLGFLHVIVEPPWTNGDNAAGEMIASLAGFRSEQPLTDHWS
jgi:alkanesulfonate monooxygenase SsuD/methylene tetrahydromethanopterin reductase-like flavin-dependent oxidoreductase (luciferase family)